jgi:aminodeoxyfutalosine deaminase
MTLQTFIEAMPKVDIHLNLEGSFDISRLLLIAEQYDIPETVKHYADWVKLLRAPDPAKLLDLIRTVNAWVKDPDDLSRIAYDIGTNLHKQGVVYAEIGVIPALYPEMANDLEGLFAGLNDGRERAERAWGIRMAWVFQTMRDDPRKVEELTRWVTLIPAQRANVIGFGLTGRDDGQGPAQYEKAFKTLEKRDVVRVVRVGELSGAVGIGNAFNALSPHRIVDGRGISEAVELHPNLIDGHIAVLVSPSRMLTHKWATAQDLPLRRLLDAGMRMVIGADMPTLYRTSLNNEYLIAVEKGSLSVDELIEVSLNAVRASMLPETEQDALIQQFRARCEELKAEHLT